MSRFDVEKFDPAPDPDLICCICQCVLDSPMESPCRHVFCKICIETWLTNHHNCPTCRRSLRTRRLKPVLPLVQNMINRLQMSCDFSTNGCKEILILEQYDSHLKVCDYEKLKCRFSKCGIELLRKDLSEHEEELCEFREKRCTKQCGLMIPISVYETHDCFVELQKFATESTALVDTLKKSVKELTELTKTMKKNLEDLSRELQGRRNRSPLSSPSYSPSYSFTSSGDDSDLSNFILDDYSNDRFGDDHSNDHHIPEITTALQMYMERSRDQRNVRWRSRNPSRNEEVIDGVQPANINTTEQAINSANRTVSIQGASAAAEGSSRSNNSDGNGNQVLGPSTAANRQSTTESRQGSHQSNEAISPTRVSTRSRSHIWDSDISVLSSSSSSSSSSSDDDVDRDFGINREEDGGHQDRDRNSDRYSYSFSSTPIHSPDRSARSPSSSGSTICNDDRGSPSVHSVISSSRGSNQSMSEIYTDDEGDGSYCSSRSASPARVSDTRQQSSHSSDQHTSINQSSKSVDSRRSKDASNMDRSRNHITENSRTIHNSGLNQSGHSLYYQINHNSSIDHSTHTVESEQEHNSSIEHSSHSESSRLEGYTSRNRSGASVESNSDKNSDFKTNPIASFSSGVTPPRNLSYCSSDQEYRQQDLRNQTASDQNDVIVVSVENGLCPVPGFSLKKYRGNATCTISACGGMSPSVGNDSIITNTTSPHKLDDTVIGVKEKRYVQVDSSINSSTIGRSPCPLPTQRPRKRKHASISCGSSNSSQERSPSPKKIFIYPSEAAFTNKTKGRGNLDNADVPENVSTQSSGEGVVSATCQQQVQVSGLSVENVRAAVITSSHVEGEITCVATNNTTISVSSKELVANKPVSSSHLTEKNPVFQLSNLSDHDISGQRECIVARFSPGNTNIEVPISENITMENRNTAPNLHTTFDLHEYNSDTDDTWEPLDSVVGSDSDMDYQEMMTDTDDTDNTNDALQNTVHGQESVAANTGSSRSESNDTWEPRISRNDNSDSDDSDDNDSYLSELDIDTDSSYEVRIPMSVAQLLDKYASEDHDSDDSWTPH